MALMVNVAGYIHGEMIKNAKGIITTAIKAFNDTTVGVPVALMLFKSSIIPSFRLGKQAIEFGCV